MGSNEDYKQHPEDEPFDERLYEVEPGSEGSDAVTRDEVERAFEEIWRELQEDPFARSTAESSGVPVEALRLEGSGPPFEAEQREEGFEVVTTIAVGAAAGVAGNYTTRLLDLLWDRYFAPKLMARLRGRIRPKHIQDHD